MRRSVNGGADWSTFEFLVRGVLDESHPALVLQGDTAFLSWVDRRHGSEDLAYRRSTSAGVSWDPLTFLVRGPARESDPTIALDGSTVLIGWSDDRFGVSDLAFRRSTDTGGSFASLTFLVRAPTNDSSPVMRLSGSNALAVWVDLRSGNQNVSYRHSGDGGISWDTATRLVSASTDEVEPACDLLGDLAVCTWSDGRVTPSVLKGRESVVGGSAWLPLRDLD